MIEMDDGSPPDRFFPTWISSCVAPFIIHISFVIKCASPFSVKKRMDNNKNPSGPSGIPFFGMFSDNHSRVMFRSRRHINQTREICITVYYARMAL